MSSTAADSDQKPRLMVLTDISSISSSNNGEPDDAQSMIRLMLYANEFDIEGLIASSTLRHGRTVRPQNIRKIVDAYAKDRANLSRHGKGYPSASRLRKLIKSGQPNADRGVPVFQSIGQGKDTQASRWIIQRADKRDERPLWITVWGGTADLAQALWKVRETRNPSEVAKFVAKIRVRAIADQDSTASWIRSQFPDLSYTTNKKMFRGMYREGDTSLVNSAWVQENIKGHGALGDLYPDYRGGDSLSYKLGRVRGIKEGDSPSFLGLVRNGLNVPNEPTWTNWGGGAKQDSNNRNRYRDAIDPVGSYRRDATPYMAAVYRWRPDFQADFAARLEWIVKPRSQANHAPVNDSDNSIQYQFAAAGKSIELRSGDWRDPDGNGLSYEWKTLKGEGSYSGSVKIENRLSRTARLITPDVKSLQTVNVLLKVTDDYQPALSSYKRFVFMVFPD